MALDSRSSSQTLLMNGGQINAITVSVAGPNNGALWVNSGSLNTTALNLHASTYNNQGGSVSFSTMLTGQTVTDPLSGLPIPSAGSAGQITTSAPCTGGATCLSAGSYGSYTFNQGPYCLAPGVYHISGIWTVNTTDINPYGSDACPTLASVGATDPGIVLYFSSGSLQLNTDFTNMSAPASGQYANLLYWQADNTSVSTYGAFSGGGWYAPQSLLTTDGGDLTTSFLIVKDLIVNSNMTINTQGGGG